MLFYYQTLIFVTYGRKSFRYYGAHVWNNVPSNIKCAQT